MDAVMAELSDGDYCGKYVESRALQTPVVGRVFAGVIEHIPEELQARVGGLITDAMFPFRVGDRVCGVVQYHGLADYVPVHWTALHRVPDHIPLELAAAMPCNYELYD